MGDLYNVIVQAIPSEVLACATIEETALPGLLRHPAIDEVIVALACIDNVDDARERLYSWGINSMAGSGYNVCRRLLEAAELLPPQEFVVRMLLLNTHTPLRYVDAQVACMRDEQPDFVTAPLDYNISLCADVASVKALERISKMAADNVEARRAHFNPCCYMDNHPEQFEVRMLEPAPVFSKNEIMAIKSNPRVRKEYHYLGRDFSAGWYDYILEYGYIPKGANVLDIACATGKGSACMAEYGASVVGCEYLAEFVAMAQNNYPEHERLKFIQGDGTTFLYKGGEFFDVVVSLHTLEHVEDDSGMALNLVRNLKPGGLLIVEAPIMPQRPVAISMTPSHLREYSADGLLALFDLPGLRVERIVNACRGHYAEGGKLREAMQAHFRKSA